MIKSHSAQAFGAKYKHPVLKSSKYFFTVHICLVKLRATASEENNLIAETEKQQPLNTSTEKQIPIGSIKEEQMESSLQKKMPKENPQKHPEEEKQRPR